MINKKWDEILAEEMKKDYFKKLGIFVKNEYRTKTVFPPYQNIFDALRFTDYDEVKVVILGQDPYHNYNQAHGLSFSVLCKDLPPSLKNIYKEMEDDLHVKVNQDGDLSYLSEQGVLLLNTILTVRHSSPLSHQNKGWEILTDRVIELLNKQDRPIVFVLWGSNAKSKRVMLNNPKHLVISSVHPSPLSAYNGFFGSKPFSKINQFLIQNNETPIQWVK